jgi:tRNA 2-thiouridine synthesizing protein A
LVIGTQIDARGMRCPWPVIRLAKAFREGAERVTIYADDPIAPAEIAALAKANGWAIVAENSGYCWHVAVNPGLLLGAV